ncbi:hypothetical protein ACFRJ1_05015 [Streptomyces sp. NPDC056773]|uniref:hypothetical protein n=1 Tax=unclassified Streptomyces TaxID=2593676 RepID=UPI00369758B0
MKEGLLVSASPVLELDANLESEDAGVVLAAAWGIFGMITQLAEDITFDEGSDELQAMIVAQRCSEGLDRLPLPQAGRPVKAPPPEPGAAVTTPGEMFDVAIGHLQEVARSLQLVQGRTAACEPTLEGPRSLGYTGTGLWTQCESHRRHRPRHPARWSGQRAESRE